MNCLASYSPLDDTSAGCSVTGKDQSKMAVLLDETWGVCAICIWCAEICLELQNSAPFSNIEAAQSGRRVDETDDSTFDSKGAW